MTFHTLPFENRWSDGEHARQWFLHLERVGVENVRLWLIVEKVRRGDGDLLPSEIPLGFADDWLSYHERMNTRRMSLWQSATAVFAALAAVMASAALWLR